MTEQQTITLREILFRLDRLKARFEEPVRRLRELSDSPWLQEIRSIQHRFETLKNAASILDMPLPGGATPSASKIPVMGSSADKSPSKAEIKLAMRAIARNPRNRPENEHWEWVRKNIWQKHPEWHPSRALEEAKKYKPIGQTDRSWTRTYSRKKGRWAARNG